MSTATDPETYVQEAAEAYRTGLLIQVRRHGTPSIDPVAAGQHAAAMTTAGQAWNDDVGPFYATDGARAALGGVSKQAVSQRVREGRLLGLRLASDGTRRDRLVYPAWQFRSTVLARLPRVLATAGYNPQRPASGWTVAAWLTAPDPDLEQVAPLAMIEAGHLDAVLAAAAELRQALGVDERAASLRGQAEAS